MTRMKTTMLDRETGPGGHTGSLISRASEQFVAAPLLLHVIAVSALLLVALGVVHPSGIWTSDEGAVRYQTELLATTGMWSTQRPFADLDPEQVASPIHASTIVDDRYSPYTKHPMLPVMLSAVRSGATEASLVLPALAGALLAAVFGALIAGSLSRRIQNATLWVLALASPLFFYGYTVLAHTIAAALGAAAVLIVLRRGDRRSLLWSVAFASVFAAALFRAEALAFGVALGIAVIVAQRTVSRSVRLPLGIGLVIAALAGRIVNQAWSETVGGAKAVSEGQGIFDWFRLISGAFSSVVLVDFGTAMTLTIVVMMTGGAALLLLSVDREPDNRRFHIAAAGVSIAGSLLLTIVIPIPIGGLVTAAPVMFAGMVLIRRADLTNRTIQLGLVTTAFFVGAVFATQERGGGGAQWGGRYLMLVVPILVPVAVFLIRRLVLSVPSASHLIIVPLVVASLVLTIDSTLVLRAGRENSAALTRRLAEVALEAATDQRERPIVLSSRTHVGRHAWRTIDSIDYFLVPEESFDLYLGRLVGDGVDRFAVVGAWTPERAALFESFGLDPVDVSVAPFVVLERAGSVPGED